MENWGVNHVKQENEKGIAVENGSESQNFNILERKNTLESKGQELFSLSLKN